MTASGTDLFGLWTFFVSWNGSVGAGTVQLLDGVVTPPASAVGTFSRTVVAGETATITLFNNANIFGGLGTRTAKLAGTFDWHIDPI